MWHQEMMSLFTVVQVVVSGKANSILFSILAARIERLAPIFIFLVHCGQGLAQSIIRIACSFLRYLSFSHQREFLSPRRMTRQFDGALTRRV